MRHTIGFYGAGNMAQVMIAGLLNSGFYQKEEIYVYNYRYEPTLKKRKRSIWSQGCFGRRNFI
ncbi:pyrroline-5-carboxylate reductase [Tetragenococcus muriaticus PMC-11-5]|uniref:Pyrroline-5-carboxylate reductase n=1 Tax=Tetragenococcus muriaticus PMC-11-5 TaxID=1302649 RepID=A0A091CAH7_9ENTE|nr:NAD(P)-binding domain-containing protein [Tetragenococcus muriaticus]KFN93607.1 pyrroline-5-carboxylate reductase [Tetragenococcus muriaticus PMC-11-5]